MTERKKLQVFISSTFFDLQEERQIAVAAILKAGHIPAGMELFTAGDKSQLEVIKRWIDQSDAYMLILGTRYGSIEPESGLSYTEIEYDYALSTGKSLFALVMGDNAVDQKLKENGAKYLEKDNPDKLKLFRGKVLSRMSALFEDKQDIRANVYESLIDLSNQPELEGWVRGGVAYDAKKLYDKIADLTALNEKLEKEIGELRLNAAPDVKSTSNENALDVIASMLKAKRLVVPASITKDGEEVNTTAYTLFVLNKNLYVKGVHLTPPLSARSVWYEKNFYATLVTHKLLDIERKSDGSRTYSLSEVGLNFSAWLDMRSLDED